jgi:hypothetical protein
LIEFLLTSIFQSPKSKDRNHGLSIWHRNECWQSMAMMNDVNPELFEKAKFLLTEYETGCALYTAQKRHLAEAVSRLHIVSLQYTEVMNLNNKLLTIDQKLSEIRKFGNPQNILKLLKKRSPKQRGTNRMAFF